MLPTKSSNEFIPSSKKTLSKRAFGQNIMNLIMNNNQMKLKRKLIMHYQTGQMANNSYRNDKNKPLMKFELKDSCSLSYLHKDNSHKSLKEYSSSKKHEITFAISKEKLKKQLNNISSKILEKSKSFGHINANPSSLMNSLSDKIPLIPLNNVNRIKIVDKKNNIPLPQKRKNNIHIINSQSKTEMAIKDKEKIQKRTNKTDSTAFIINSNSQIVSEYRMEIYNNMIEEEKKTMHLINSKYMMNQKNEIDSHMRSILIDWIIEVHDKFDYSIESLFLSVSIIDRYLSLKQITRSQYQLAGVAALYIACKHEEIDLPNPKEFVDISDNAFTQKELFKMEYQILDALDFALLLPTSYRLFQYLAVEFHLNKQQYLFGHYLLHNTLIDYNVLKYSNSFIACSCLYLTMKFFKLEGIDRCFDKSYSNNSDMNTWKECVDDICLFFEKVGTSKFPAAKIKFRRDKYSQVSCLLDNKTLCK